MNFNRKHIISGVIATSVVLPLCSTISNADSVEYKVITGNSVNFRTGPGTNYSSICKLNKGYKVEYIGTKGSWVQAKYNGTTGYVHGDYVDTYTESNTITKVVTATNLNVRSGAGTNYSVIGSLKNGTIVPVISESNGWSKINYNGKTGYVSSNYLGNKNTSSDNTSSSESIKYKKIVTATNLNFRSGPSTSSSKIGSIKEGTEVGVISESNGWSKINYNGKVGYVSSQYLADKASSSSTSSKIDKLISFAKAQLGKTYSWGAEGPNSFDCSGFTYYVFKESANKTIPRLSKDQSEYGTYVSYSNLRKGDLVFFDTDGSNNGVVGHVGIYLGDGEFIHSSSSKGKVIISNITSGYYKDAFVNGRRVL